jgi:hypothetical protein
MHSRSSLRRLFTTVLLGTRLSAGGTPPPQTAPHPPPPAHAPVAEPSDVQAISTRAETPHPASIPPRPRPSRPLAVAAAVVPGALAHGAGHYALGQPATARRLLAMEGIGLGLFLGGGLTLALTGASRYFVAPAAASTLVGFGLFSTSYLADIYGTTSTDGAAALSRYRMPARWETELGYWRVQDPQFAYRDFVVERVSRQLGPVRLSPSGLFSLSGDTARYRIEGSYRLLGIATSPRPHELGFLDATLGFVHQRHHPEHFTRSSAELSLDARYDLGRLGNTLRGSFIELGAGYALARVDYNLRGLAVPSDLEHLLLGRIAFGAVLRGQSAPGSEAEIYYDHRHDDYAAGLKLPGIGSGVLGHFGAKLRWFFDDGVGLALDVQAGSAYVAGASLIVRSREGK